MAYDFDPELAAAAAMIPMGSLTDIPAARAMFEQMMADTDLSGLDVSDHSVPVTGAPDATVRVYAPPDATSPRPGILYIHGGGFVVGSIRTEEAGAADLARRLGVVVASVEYRLAPEHPYPAGLDDCTAALVWLHDHAADFGVDVARLAVFGSSAGGGLAAALALRTRDRADLPRLCFQFLGIPELDDRLSTPSMTAFVDTPMWNRPAAEVSWASYLGGITEVPYDAAPARATDLSGLPPAYVTVMEFDPLRDEGIDYAARMMQAGVSVELHAFPGTSTGRRWWPTLPSPGGRQPN